MLNYIISVCIVIITVCVIYFIDKSFESYKINTKKPDPLETNVLADCVVFISRDGCPYCTKLYEELKNYSKSKYTIIKIADTGGFIFDDTFTELKVSERDNIIDEITKVINTGVVYFPTLLFKNTIHRGLPNSEKLKEIFN